MKKTILFIVALQMSLFAAFAQDVKPEAVKPKTGPVRFTLQASIGGIHEAVYDASGVCDNIAGMIEGADVETLSWLDVQHRSAAGKPEPVVRCGRN